jgi:hypothetical protein
MSDMQNASNPPVRKTITTDSPEWKNSYFMQLEQIRARDKRESQAEIADLIVQAWERVRETVEKNPDELMARLARRRNRTLSRPPRAWCAAVRANDLRITPMNAIMVPEDAAWGVHGDPNSYRQHTVTLNAELLRWVCRPVRCDWPYNTVQEIQKKLGWSKLTLERARKRGVFEERKIPHLDGKTGLPIPVLYTHRPLDPCSRGGEYPDVVWGTTIRYVCDHIPDDLSQTVRRVPIGWKLPQVRNEDKRAFMGWRWICPACGKMCRTIYYPLPPMTLVELMKGGEIHRKDPGNPDAISPGHQTFACNRCHRVLNYTRISKDEWNQLIGHISGGLLYGYEVRRPTWYEPRRKRRYAAQLRRPPCQRREEVRKRMEWGMKLVEIAMEMKVDIDSVRYHVEEIYRQTGVKNLKEFRKKFCRGNLPSDRGRTAESTSVATPASTRDGECEHAEDHACA